MDLGINALEKYDKYFGLLAIIGRFKKLIFSSIHDQICIKLYSWKE